MDAKCEGMAELLAEKAKALEEGSSQQEEATSHLREQLEAAKVGICRSRACGLALQ